MRINILCKNCGEEIEPTGGKLYKWTHVDPNQQKCHSAKPLTKRKQKPREKKLTNFGRVMGFDK